MTLHRPEVSRGTGVLVLAGSSGRADAERAAVLAAAGATTLAIRWFGGPGQSPGPYGVALEVFGAALDLLAAECDRLAIVGTSFGAEAALLTAAFDERVTATVAFAPTSVVWPGWDGSGWISHWTRDGAPLPYTPLREDAWPTEEPPAYVDLYARSLADAPRAAEIPVERIRGDLVLVAGGDDQVWPSVEFADRIERRRAAYGLATTVVEDAAAGHRAVLPGEALPSPDGRLRRGGSPAADRALGETAWPTVLSALGLAQA